MLNREEYGLQHYMEATILIAEFWNPNLDDTSWRKARIINILVDDLYQKYSEKELGEDGWSKHNPYDGVNLPENGQKVTYFFLPFGTFHDGEYDDGSFSSGAGFCDMHDATHWKPR
jgi:hypothetical protein